MEILGMSIIVAASLAAILGLGVRNSLGYLRNTEEPFDIRQALASGLIGVILGIPSVVIVFEAAFGDVESLPETTQLVLFFSQVAAVAGIEAIGKSSVKAVVARARAAQSA
jgi:ABC-type amino acid transport system permease subunit